MDFKAYFYGLSNAEREAFAYRAGTTVRYIQCHLVNRRKVPRRRSLFNLASASKGQVTLNDLLAHFYQPDAREVHRPSIISLVPTCSGIPSHPESSDDDDNVHRQRPT